MPISINGTGTITGISAGGLPDDCITTADIAASAVTTAKILDANITSAKLSQPMTLGTAVATTSGTLADITGIPSWAKRVTVSIYNFSFAGTDNGLIQLGVGTTPTTTGYNSVTQYLQGGASSGQLASTSGFIINSGAAAYVFYGTYIFTKHSGSTWVGSSVLSCNTSVNFGTISNGVVTLSGDLGMVRVLGTLGGALDGGSINIMYEG